MFMCVEMLNQYILSADLQWCFYHLPFSLNFNCEVTETDSDADGSDCGCILVRYVHDLGLITSCKHYGVNTAEQINVTES
jgi:hypothetical protein